MCKYCKNLKRLKDLDEKEFMKLVNFWRHREMLARKLLERCQDMILDCQITPYNSERTDISYDPSWNEDVILFDDITSYLFRKVR